MTTRRDAVDSAIVDALIDSGEWRSVIVHNRDRIVRNAALEEAAKACERLATLAETMAPRRTCAEAIRALKSDAP